MTVTAHVERLVHCLEELKPHFDPHWAELALDREKVPLDPQYNAYLARDALGEVLCVTLREAGRIVAYFVGFVAPGMHYRQTLTLTMDIFWVHPDYRSADSLETVEREMLGLQLFQAVEKEGRRRGIKRVFYGTKLSHEAGKLFTELGMREVERYYSGWWGD